MTSFLRWWPTGMAVKQKGSWESYGMMMTPLDYWKSGMDMWLRTAEAQMDMTFRMVSLMPSWELGLVTARGLSDDRVTLRSSDNGEPVLQALSGIATLTAPKKPAAKKLEPTAPSAEPAPEVLPEVLIVHADWSAQSAAQSAAEAVAAVQATVAETVEAQLEAASAMADTMLGAVVAEAEAVTTAAAQVMDATFAAAPEVMIVRADWPDQSVDEAVVDALADTVTRRSQRSRAWWPTGGGRDGERGRASDRSDVDGAEMDATTEATTEATMEATTEAAEAFSEAAAPFVAEPLAAETPLPEPEFLAEPVVWPSPSSGRTRGHGRARGHVRVRESSGGAAATEGRAAAATRRRRQPSKPQLPGRKIRPNNVFLRCSTIMPQRRMTRAVIPHPSRLLVVDRMEASTDVREISL